jgi:arylsulfatase A-like enzyme
VVDEIGTANDIAPTFARAAGLSALPAIDGLDITDMVTRRGKPPHDLLFWSYSRQKAVRRGEWKLILNPRTSYQQPIVEKVWLSNLRQDPAEERNWASERPEIVRELGAELDRWSSSIESVTPGHTRSVSSPQ